MSGRGRRAALPQAGSSTPRGLITGADGRPVVRCFSDGGEGYRDFDVSVLGTAAPLREALVAALVKRTAPGGGTAALSTMYAIYLALVHFDRYLGGLRWPPQEPAHLTPEHFDGFYQHCLQRRRSAVAELRCVRLLLLATAGISDLLAGRLAGEMPRTPGFAPKKSYSRREVQRIAAAARDVLRQAAARIRDNREVLRRFRDGDLIVDRNDIHLKRRLELLDHVDRFADVPRTVRNSGWHPGRPVPAPWVTHRGSVRDIVSWLHLTPEELAAGAVLLSVMTGQNPDVIFKVPAVHHRADGHTGSAGTAIVELHKPRRGRRAHMSLALSEIPDWISITKSPQEYSARAELHTPFGLYTLLHELTARSRAMAGGNRLLVGHYVTGTQGRGVRALRGGSGLVTKVGRRWGLMADALDEQGQPVPLPLRLDLLRLSFIELHQKPVAHTEQTAATVYLARNRGNVAEYQKVVADTLTGEVAKARARGRVATMSAAEVERVRADPETVAAELHLDPLVLKRMVAGELDTALAACTDNTNSPYSAAGQPCRASFLLCLDCPCARSLPRHLPVQVLVHDRLVERRRQMNALHWAQRFAGPHAQLADLLDQHDATVVDGARHNAGPTEHALADRLLNRELDLR